MKKLLSLLTHPLFLSILLTAVIAWFFLPPVNKYNLRITEQVTQKDNLFEYYDDLDGNGYSDKLVFHSYADQFSGVTVHFNPRLYLAEWDFRGLFNFMINSYFLTGDYDGNGQKEIYLFTVSNDSLFLHGVLHPFEKNPSVISRFIEVVGNGMKNEKLHFNIVQGGLEDLNQDHFKELVFAVNFGISTIPRYVFSYDIKNDVLSRSPKNGYHITKLSLEDINGDGTREIIVNGYASQNYTDTLTFPINDLCCWLIVLDRNLQFAFDPVRIPSYGYSEMTTLGIMNKSGCKGLFSFYFPPLQTRKGMTLFHFDQNGKTISRKNFPEIKYGEYTPPFVAFRKNTPLLAIGTTSGMLYLFDTLFQTVSTQTIGIQLSEFGTKDLDNDHADEIVFLDHHQNNAAIFRHDLSDPVILPILLDNSSKTVLSVINEPGKAPLLSISSGVHQYLLLYTKNLYFYYRWAVYAGIFLSIYLLILLIGNTQRLRIEKIRRTEKKITELQLKIVRNQMDPHFTLNAINSVIDAVNREEKQQATDNLLHFSQMYRSLVLSADKIQRTLKEEIEFTENYVSLEKFPVQG